MRYSYTEVWLTKRLKRYIPVIRFGLQSMIGQRGWLYLKTLPVLSDWEWLACVGCKKLALLGHRGNLCRWLHER